MEKTDNRIVFTLAGRLTYPNLFEPRAVGPKGKAGDNSKAKYSANFIFEPTHPDLPSLKKLCVAAAKKKWPNRDPKDLKFPWSTGDSIADKRSARGKADSEHLRGKIVVVARSTFQPGLAVVVDRKLVELDTDELQAQFSKCFYAGVEVVPEFSVAVYEGVGSNPDGINLYLNSVLSLNKGEKIAGTGTKSLRDTFAHYAGSLSAEDPTAGMEDFL